ncbi:MAG: PAS domain-containing protein [Bacteroidales bacterium]|nr:PAS domain-containing protein [Bacteroidales bacterium]
MSDNLENNKRDKENKHSIISFSEITPKANSGIENFAEHSIFFLDKIQSIYHLGIYILDVKTGYWTSSYQLNQLFEIDETYNRTINGWGNIVHPDEREMMLSYYSSYVIGQKKSFDKKYRIITIANKKEKWVHGKGELRFNTLGEPVQMIGIIQDISDQIHTQTQLNEKSTQLDHFFQMALDLLCVADTEGRFIRMNPEWQKLLGYSQDELENHKFLDFVHPDDLESTIKAISELKKQRQVLNFVNRYKRKDGTYKFIEWRSTPSGNRIYAAARDITERIEFENNLKKINLELKEANAQKDKLISIIAHDIRNPLNNILGLVDLLKNNYNISDFDDFETIISLLDQSTNQMYRLIENLLQWALTKTFSNSISIKEVELNELIYDSAILLTPIAKAKNIDIQIDAKRKYYVLGDENMIKTIFRNLISNAIKFSHPQSIIKIKCKQNNQFISTKIIDNGIGMSHEKLETIFSSTYFENSTGTTGENGSGLGLPLCNELVHKLGGYITVKSEPGKGSEFKIILNRSRNINND